MTCPLDSLVDNQGSYFYRSARLMHIYVYKAMVYFTGLARCKLAFEKLLLTKCRERSNLLLVCLFG